MGSYKVFISLALTLVLLTPTCLASFSLWGLQDPLLLGVTGQIRSRGQQVQNECNIERLNANEPNLRIQAEAGVTEIWNSDDPEFRCAGVKVIRQIVEPGGLVQPFYANAPALIYVDQGEALAGVVVPGCPETFESGFNQEREYQIRGGQETERGSYDRRQEGSRGFDERSDRPRDEGGRSFEEYDRSGDRHQKVRRLREGDIFAIPAGFSTWFHNYGQSRLVLITMYDTNSFQNQLDQKLRKFHIAGNPQESSHGGESRREQSMRPLEKRQHGEHGLNLNNILSGFDDEFLTKVLKVNKDTVDKIQGNKDDRGNIVFVQGDLTYLLPDSYEEEQEFRQERGQYKGGRQNGLEETLCTAKLTHNIDEARKADVFNPQGGRFTSLNSNKLPILNFLQLNANRVRLYPNAVLAPHWKINAHTIAYYTSGSGRVQVVDDQGNQVFDDQVQQGQLLIFPQNYAVLKQADQDGLEWVEFLTNDQAMISPLAGRTSIFRGLPEEVIVSAYDMSREEARKLKYNQEELTVLSPSSRSSQRGTQQRGAY